MNNSEVKEEEREAVKWDLNLEAVECWEGQGREESIQFNIHIGVLFFVIIFIYFIILFEIEIGTRGTLMMAPLISHSYIYRSAYFSCLHPSCLGV